MGTVEDEAVGGGSEAERLGTFDLRPTDPLTELAAADINRLLSGLRPRDRAFVLGKFNLSGGLGGGDGVGEDGRRLGAIAAEAGVSVQYVQARVNIVLDMLRRTVPAELRSGRAGAGGGDRGNANTAARAALNSL
jgi:hypothetical protein